MIQRIRYPDGTNHDIDRGPGPVGRMSMPGRGRHVAGALVSQSIEVQPPKLGLTIERNRRFRESKR